jgi:flagellar secretion chaperone FliS
MKSTVPLLATTKTELDERMDEMSYQQQALAGATGVELIVALYDGLIRFLYRAMQCVEEGDAPGRRVAVKKAIDILMYLQARLRPDVGGAVAASLVDFYSAMFTLTLEASHLESKEQFEEVISFVRNVREAWVVVARDPEAGKVLPRELRTREEKFLPAVEAHSAASEAGASRWSA